MNVINKLLEVMCRLRDPENGCSWDVQEALDRLLQRNLQRVESSIYSDVFLASEDIRHRFRGTELPSNPIDVVAGLDG